MATVVNFHNIIGVNCTTKESRVKAHELLELLDDASESTKFPSLTCPRCGELMIGLRRVCEEREEQEHISMRFLNSHELVFSVIKIK